MIYYISKIESNRNGLGVCMLFENDSEFVDKYNCNYDNSENTNEYDREPYFIGLDIGTNSVGWAVAYADDYKDKVKYQLVRKNNKDLWGVRLLESASTAANRRIKRCARRRLNRKKHRISLLQQLFNEPIASIDPGFFIRLKESHLHLGDRDSQNNNQINSLFNDITFNDKAYFKKYPTIYHLRHALTTDEAKDIKDPRLLYLAINHMLKHRGNFLYDDQDFEGDNITSISELLQNLVNSYNNLCRLGNIDAELEDASADFTNVIVDSNQLKELQSFLIDRNQLKDDKIERLKLFFNDWLSNVKDSEQVAKTIFGYTIKLTNIISSSSGVVDLLPEGVTNICFKDGNAEDILDEVSDIEELYEYLYNLYELYVAIKYKEIIGDYVSISEAKIAVYNEHGEQIRLIKKGVKSVNDEILSRGDCKSLPQFIVDEIITFSDSEKEVNARKVLFSNFEKENEFVSAVDKLVAKMKGFHKDNVTVISELKKYILKLRYVFLEQEYDKLRNAYSNDTFLICQRRNMTDNGIIPNQIHVKELKSILNNQHVLSNFPFLLEKDLKVCGEDKTTKGKIISLLKFRIPYWVGPLNNHVPIGLNKHPFAWAEKNVGMENKKILPWNFNEIVNTTKAATDFITRMTCKCTYLRDKDVLPKSSYLYSKFMVLNELNNLKINGNKIPNDKIKDLFENLFLKQGKVTLKKIKEFLRLGEDDTLTGCDDEFASNMSVYVSIKNKFRDFKISFNDVKEEIKAIEKIIYIITLFPNGEILNERIISEVKTVFGSLDENDRKKFIKSLKKTKISGWGKLSRELLETFLGKKVGEDETQSCSIIERMLRGEGNLQEIVASDMYTYRKKIDDKYNNRKVDSESYEELVENLYTSPANKRAIWQSLLLVNEIRHIMRHDPEKVFVEVTRDTSVNTNNGKSKKGKKTQSRYKALESNLYEKITNEVQEYNQNIRTVFNNFKNCKGKYEDKLNDEKVYLYYKQYGLCMYTGEPLDLDMLSSYEVDHVIPRCLTKDDSFDNKVLVTKKANQDKKGKYPLPLKFHNDMRKKWDFLKERKAISSTLYASLTKRDDYTDSEIRGFINRQLVFTSQSIKCVNDVLRTILGDEKVVYSRAANVKDFMKIQQAWIDNKPHYVSFLKSREVNNLHHAKDAYLNICVGNECDKGLVGLRKDYENNKWLSNDECIEKFNKTTCEYIFKINKTSKYITSNNGELVYRIYSMFKKNNPMVTYHRELRTGEFYDETIYSGKKLASSNNIKKMSLKANLPIKEYGYKDKIKNSYYVFVSYQGSRKLEYKFEAIPIYLKNASNDEKISYLKELLSSQDVKILLDEIKIPMILKDNDSNTILKISGFTGERYCYSMENPLVLEDKNVRTVNLISNYLKKKENDSSYKITVSNFKDNSLKELLFELQNKLSVRVYNKYAKLQSKIINISILDVVDKDISEELKEILKLVLSFNNSNAVEFKKLFKSAESELIDSKDKKTESKDKINCPKLRTRNFVKDKDDFSIINSSVTGFYVKEIRLKDLIK